MGSEELAADLFRITQTESKLKKRKIGLLYKKVLFFIDSMLVIILIKGVIILM